MRILARIFTSQLYLTLLPSLVARDISSSPDKRLFNGYFVQRIRLDCTSRSSLLGGITHKNKRTPAAFPAPVRTLNELSNVIKQDLSPRPIDVISSRRVGTEGYTLNDVIVLDPHERRTHLCELLPSGPRHWAIRLRCSCCSSVRRAGRTNSEARPGAKRVPHPESRRGVPEDDDGEREIENALVDVVEYLQRRAGASTTSTGTLK